MSASDDIAFCRLPSALRIGARYFEERALEVDATRPSGLVDRIGDLASRDCDPDLVPAEVKVFFEDTATLELRIEPAWRAGVRLFARAFFAVMRCVGQFAQPMSEALVLTRMVAIDRARDGRHDARGVIRTYRESGAPMQVVAYATSERSGTRYMNAAFPLPIGNLSGLLRLELVKDDGGEVIGGRLTSKRRAGKGDRSGVWLVWRGLRLPLPLAETMTLTVATDDDRRAFEGATIAGRHEQWLFGVRVVRYAYLFRPLTSSGARPRA